MFEDTIETTIQKIQEEIIYKVSELCYKKIVQVSTEDGSYERVSRNYKLSPETLSKLFQVLAHNESVKELSLRGNLSSPHPQELRQLFRKKRNLVVLNLGENSGVWEGGFVPPEIITPSLKTLILTNNGFAPYHLTEVCQQFKSSDVELLDISKNKLGDEGIAMVLSSFEGNTVLKEIILHGNGMTRDFRRKRLPSLVQKIPGLRNVDIGAGFWDKRKGKQLIKDNEVRNFPMVCNAFLMCWWRESMSPYSASPLKTIIKAIITRILVDLRDTYAFKLPDQVIGERVNDFIERKNKAVFQNLFPNHLIDLPQIVPLEVIREERQTEVYNYALTANGQLLFAKKFEGVGGAHIDLLQKYPARALGEAAFVQGKWIEYDNASGHYLPSPEASKQEMNTAIKALGIPEKEKKSVRFVSKEWVENKDKSGGRWVPVKRR